MREIVLNEVLIPALCRLYMIDYDNIVFWRFRKKHLCEIGLSYGVYYAGV